MREHNTRPRVKLDCTISKSDVSNAILSDRPFLTNRPLPKLRGITIVPVTDDTQKSNLSLRPGPPLEAFPFYRNIKKTANRENSNPPDGSMGRHGGVKN